MAAQAKHVVFDEVTLSELGNGFRGRNLIESDDFELTFVTGDAEAGHEAHVHNDLDEILIVMEGHCDFTVDGARTSLQGGSLLYVPAGVHHGVTYRSRSKVLRLKKSKTERRS